MESVKTTYTELEPEDENEVLYVDEVAPETAAPLRYHWYVYDPEPPLPDAENIILLPTSAEDVLSVIVTDGSEATVTFVSTVVE